MRSKLVSRTKLMSVALAGVAIVALAGCKGYSSTDGDGDAQPRNAASSQEQPQAQPQAQAPEPQPAPAGDGSTLSVVNHPQLGQIVVDAQGFTLYRFDNDTAKPSKSNCNGDCAKKWPPALSPTNWKDVTVSGIDRKLVGQIERADGTCQLTIAGWPAYRFQPDAKPGDIKGQGVGGTWFVLTPEGKKAGATPAPGGNASSTGSAASAGNAPAPAPAAPSSGYGY